MWKGKGNIVCKCYNEFDEYKGCKWKGILRLAKK